MLQDNEMNKKLGSYSPSSVSPSSSVLSPIVPFVASINIGPNVCPALGPSPNILTSALGPSPTTSTLHESGLVILLRYISSPNVAPPSVDALNIISPLLSAVLLV